MEKDLGSAAARMRGVWGRCDGGGRKGEVGGEAMAAAAGTRGAWETGQRREGR